MDLAGVGAESDLALRSQRAPRLTRDTLKYVRQNEKCAKHTYIHCRSEGLEELCRC